MLYEVKVSYLGIDENSGKEKTIKTVLLISGESFGDVETQAHEDFEGHVALTVSAIKVSTLKDVVSEETEGRFFLVVTEFTDLDDSSGKQKKSKHESLVRAEDTDKASAILRAKFTDSVIDWEIKKVAFSPIDQLINIDVA